MNSYMIINAQNNFLHNLVCVVLLHVHFLKQTDLNITEFLPKPSYFPKIAHLRVYHKTHLIKKQIIKYGNILLGVHFNLRYSKLKSDY